MTALWIMAALLTALAGLSVLARDEAALVRAMWGPLIAAPDPADPRRADLERRMPGRTE